MDNKVSQIKNLIAKARWKRVTSAENVDPYSLLQVWTRHFETKRIQMLEKKQDEFSIVYPTCEMCGEFKCSRKKKTSQKRASDSIVSEKPSKRAKT